MQKSKEYKAELMREATKLIKELETEEGEIISSNEDEALLAAVMMNDNKEESQSND